jgi:chromosomal replication initiator protein
VTDAAELWTTCAGFLKQEVSEAVWMSSFEGLEAKGLEGDTFSLSAPSALVKQRLEERYRGIIEQVISEVGGCEAHLDISIRPVPNTPLDPGFDLGRPSDRPNGRATDTNGGGIDTDDPDLSEPAITTPRPKSEITSGSNEANGAEPPMLNSRYTFEAFVIGASNRFAHAAAQRVAETPAASYNPLFIYGDSGLGKTHLLHAIGHYVFNNFSAKRVRYVSTETFMNDFVEAIRNSSQASFKRRYRETDVLLVDDIQFLEGKEGLQEEFFHTFNWLYESNKQIVLSSDRHPRSIPTLQDRLRSRFEWGLTTDVQPPELETRLAILRKKAERERMPIPGDVLELIATHVRDNIRKLEGALIRVTAYASLNHEPPSLEKAEEILADILEADRPRQITPQIILEATADTFGFTVEELKGTSRRRPLVNARQIGMYVFRELTDFSYPAIAREFGGRDHTTVIHAVEKVSRLMKERRQVYDQVTALISTIRGGR